MLNVTADDQTSLKDLNAECLFQVILREGGKSFPQYCGKHQPNELANVFRFSSISSEAREFPGKRCERGKVSVSIVINQKLRLKVFKSRYLGNDGIKIHFVCNFYCHRSELHGELRDYAVTAQSKAIIIASAVPIRATV